MKYPSFEEIEEASKTQLAVWYRFIQSPQDSDEHARLNRICERFTGMGGMTPEISKKIGHSLKLAGRIYDQQSD